MMGSSGSASGSARGSRQWFDFVQQNTHTHKKVTRQYGCQLRLLFVCVLMKDLMPIVHRTHTPNKTTNPSAFFLLFAFKWRLLPDGGTNHLHTYISPSVVCPFCFALFEEKSPLNCQIEKQSLQDSIDRYSTL